MNKKKLTDEERLAVFMQSFHAMSQKRYWPQLRAQGRVDLIGKAEFKIDRESGTVTMRQSPLDPLAVDLAGAYMRKLLTGTDLVSFGNLLNILKRTFGDDNYLKEARAIWRQTEERRFEFLATGNRITTMKLDFPPEWAEGRGRDEGERREVALSIADFATPYFYTGFLHDYDPSRDNETRKLARSVPPVLLEYFVHLAVAASLYISVIAHHAISIRRPDLCPDDCREAALMARNASPAAIARPEDAAVVQPGYACSKQSKGMS